MAASQKLTNQLSEAKMERDRLLNEKEDRESKLQLLTSEKEHIYNSSQTEVSSLAAQLEKLKFDTDQTQKVKINFD